MKTGVNILKANADLTQEQIDYLDTHTIDIENHSEGESDPKGDNSSEADSHNENTNMVRGKTTFRELLDMGVPEDVIEVIIGGEIPNHLMLVRDYCAENELEFSTIKAELQAEVDKIH
ncbi:MAG: hypothetical protein ISR58_16825 [Anaerolineales bacterium]|nr:hypothetical protein [Chloroflexota bacterium]MBL6982839.1 hypothetical protein [Anaerolineales bacterium]